MPPLEVQVFGTKKNPDTRKALRFFAERRIKTHFVDFAQRSPAAGELRRFVQKFGTAALVDRNSKRFAELGFTHAAYGDEKWLAILADEPLILKQPLVRNANLLTIGDAEPTWKEWVGR